MISDTKLCERCGVYIGHRPQIVTIHAPLMAYRGRLCSCCCDTLTGKLEAALESFETREVTRS